MAKTALRCITVRLPNIAEYSAFQADQLNKISKKIGKTLKSPLKAVRRKQMFRKAAAIEAHTVHVSHTQTLLTKIKNRAHFSQFTMQLH